MTEDDLIKIEERCINTSTDKWFVDIDKKDASWPGPFSLKDGIPLTFGYDGEEGIYGEKEDFEFIAHARQDIPLLIAEIRRLKEQLTNKSSGLKPRAIC